MLPLSALKLPFSSPAQSCARVGDLDPDLIVRPARVALPCALVADILK